MDAAVRIVMEPLVLALLGLGAIGHIAFGEELVGFHSGYTARLGARQPDALVQGRVVRLQSNHNDRIGSRYKALALDTAAIGHLVGQVGACPVEDGHEVIGHDVHAALAEVQEALLVVVDVALEVARLRLNVLVNRHALHGCPTHSGILYHLLALENLLFCPDFAVRDVMQRGDDASGTRLPDVLQAYRVVGAIPTETLFAKYHGIINGLNCVNGFNEF